MYPLGIKPATFAFKSDTLDRLANGTDKYHMIIHIFTFDYGFVYLCKVL